MARTEVPVVAAAIVTPRRFRNERRSMFCSMSCPPFARKSPTSLSFPYAGLDSRRILSQRQPCRKGVGTSNQVWQVTSSLLKRQTGRYGHEREARDHAPAPVPDRHRKADHPIENLLVVFGISPSSNGSEFGGQRVGGRDRIPGMSRKRSRPENPLTNRGRGVGKEQLAVGATVQREPRSGLDLHAKLRRRLDPLHVERLAARQHAQVDSLPDLLGKVLHVEPASVLAHSVAEGTEGQRFEGAAELVPAGQRIPGDEPGSLEDTPEVVGGRLGEA